MSKKGVGRSSPKKRIVAGPTTLKTRRDGATLKRATVYLRPDQEAALRQIAVDRWVSRQGVGRADASEVLREAIDSWLRSQRKRGRSGAL